MFNVLCRTSKMCLQPRGLVNENFQENTSSSSVVIWSFSCVTMKWLVLSWTLFCIFTSITVQCGKYFAFLMWRKTALSTPQLSVPPWAAESRQFLAWSGENLQVLIILKNWVKAHHERHTTFPSNLHVSLPDFQQWILFRKKKNFKVIVMLLEIK